MKDIFFMRHGETDYNKQHRVQGRGINVGINELGRAQSQAFFERYKDEGFELLLSSSLRRTHETLAPFIALGLPWEQHSDIDEMDWGKHEGQAFSESMHHNYTAMVAAWQRFDYDARLEGGESARELETRVERFLRQLVQRPERKILVCSHGRTLRCIATKLYGRDLRDMEQFSHHNTGTYRALWDGKRFEVLMANDTSHLDGVLQGQGW